MTSQPKTDQERDIDRIMALIERATVNVAQAMQHHCFMSYRETGGPDVPQGPDHPQRTLEILSAPGTVPGLSYTALPDGTISARLNGEETEMRLDRQRAECEAMVSQALADLIAEETLRLMGRRTVSLEAMTHPRVAKATQDAGHSMMRELQGRDAPPAWMDSRKGWSGRGDPQYIILNLLTKHEDWLVLDRLIDSHQGHSVSDYNMVARNGRVFRTMEQKHSNPLHFYATHITKLDREPMEFKHPGEVIRTVRRFLKLTNPQWKTFTRIPANAWPSVTPPSTVQKVCDIITRANVPHAKPESLKGIVPNLARHDVATDAQWSQGNPVDAWAGLARAFLECDIHYHSFNQATEVRDLPRIADALRESIEQDMPWGPGDWHTLSHRSDRWHRQVVQRARRQEQQMARERENSSWESAVDHAVQGDFTFRAANTGLILLQLGDQLDNCLSTQGYWNNCVRGLTRVFSVEQDGELAGAAALHLQDGQWLAGQCEGPSNTDPPKGLEKALQKVAQLYQQASQDSEHKLQGTTS